MIHSFISRSAFDYWLQRFLAVCAATVWLFALAYAFAMPARAQDARFGGDTTLPDVTVIEKPTLPERYSMPQTTVSTTAEQIEQTVNLVDTEDAVKYFPSIFLRKRNYGDTQAVMATRTWGVGSSARSLVYADDVLLSALVANNNTIGAPRWGMVAPEEIERIDVMYGPFSAAYPGNAMGAVMHITTRMPDKAEASFKQTEALQTFNFYGTKDNYRTDQSGATIGNRFGDFSFWLSANHEYSKSQPLTWITSNAAPGASGSFIARNKLGAQANVVGAGGMLEKDMDTAKLKLAYDITPELRATYAVGYWSNNASSNVQTFLRNGSGNETFTGLSGFATNRYELRQAHSMHSLSVKSDSRSEWDVNFAATHYSYDTDNQRTPNGVLTGVNTTPGFTNAGKIARQDGTSWSTIDAKAIWRPFGFSGPHEASFGVHGDRYTLVNATYNTPDWVAENNVYSTPGLFSDGRGHTETGAIWLQDAWKFAPGFKATLGVRLEQWRALGGFNLASGVAIFQPTVTKSNVSPKASLMWEPGSAWTITASYGNAYRYPTVSELYQLVTTGATQTSPNPNLLPEQIHSGELAFERIQNDGRVRVSLFQENVADALISQSSTLNNVVTSFVQNVTEIRNRGLEVAGQLDNVLWEGLGLGGSVTYVDSRIIANNSWVSTTGTTSVGKHVPNVPDWRTTFFTTYKPVEGLTLTGAVRYQGKQYTTMDNTDIVDNVYGAFDSFVVADLRAHYRMNERLEGAIGIDNVNNHKYHLFHPFPQRTFLASLKVRL